MDEDNDGKFPDGSPAPAGTADRELLYPCCFRDGSEIRGADGEER